MITDLVLDFLQAALLGLLALLVPFQVPAAGSLDLLAAANIVFPVSELVVVFGVIVAYAGGSLLWMLIWRAYHAIRG